MTAALTSASTNNILTGIYSATACCDTSDVLGNVETIWNRVGGSLVSLLDHKGATARVVSLAKRYAVLARKQSAADAAANLKYYEVAQFERLFAQLLND